MNLFLNRKILSEIYTKQKSNLLFLRVKTDFVINQYYYDKFNQIQSVKIQLQDYELDDLEDIEKFLNEESKFFKTKFINTKIGLCIQFYKISGKNENGLYDFYYKLHYINDIEKRLTIDILSIVRLNKIEKMNKNYEI